VSNHLINPFGWRKWSLAIVVIGIATALSFDTLPGGERYMSADEWSWFVIRVVLLYITGNVSKEAVGRFMGVKKSDSSQ